MSATETTQRKTRTEDVVFFAVKDMTHGIIGMAADGTMAGGHYDVGYEQKEPVNK